MEKPKVLVVEDDESIRTQMRWALIEKYDPFLAGDAAAAMKYVVSQRPSIVTLDLGLPPHPEDTTEGFKLLEDILRHNPLTKVVVVTGTPDKSAAYQAIASGAYDFFSKPVDIEELKGMLKRAHYLYTLEEEYRRLQRDLKTGPETEIIGSSREIQNILGTVRKIATSDVPVLITGESGTGKELIATTIHKKSLRSDKPFIPINCGAIPENLMESELFGHEKGSFTGAHVKRKGRIEMAEEGTLFLDEVGELPLSLQVKLLRFLQDHRIESIGGRESKEIDVRVIAATNKDLAKKISEGLFREDLYYRLAVVSIHLPALRERRDDIPLLAKAFMDKFATAASTNKHFGKSSLLALTNYDWPGNIRELENMVRRTIALSEGPVINPEDLGIEVPRGADTPQSLDMKKAKDELEITLIRAAIAMHGGNISRSAEELGLTRQTLHTLLNKHNIHVKHDTEVSE